MVEEAGLPVRHGYSSISHVCGEGFLYEAYGFAQLITLRVYPQEQVYMIRHDDVFAAGNPFAGFSCHVNDEMIMKVVCSQYRHALMRAEGD